MSNGLCIDNGHIGKVVEWKYELIDGDVVEGVKLWGCTRCDATSDKVWDGFGEYRINKEPCSENCICFGCKVQTLQLNTGDASRDISDKAWTGKLANYRKAREQGIQPGGTSPHMVEAAYRASETLGKAYDGNTMIPAHRVTKGVAAVMKEIGD